MDRPIDALPEGSKLAGYVIGAVLGRGSFGVTYLAADDLFPDKKFAIKEFLPLGIAARKAGHDTVHPISAAHAETFARALASFRREALTLRELSHPNVVDVQRYIEQNGTAYVVMRYEEGDSLDRALRTGPLSEEEIGELLPPLLDGLAAIHAKNFVHRDLKPGNIYLRADGSPVLLDFGAAREAIGTAREGSLSEIVTPGYAPLEQYDRHAEQGPYTDIYALGATLYRCMTGRPPPDAITRHNALRRGATDPLEPIERAAPGRYSARLAASVRRMLEIDERKRPQTVGELRGLLGMGKTERAAEAAPIAAGSARAAPVQAAAAPRARAAASERPETMVAAPRRRKGVFAWAFAVGIVAIGAAAMALYRPWEASEPASNAATTVPPPPPPRAADAPQVNRDCPQCPELVTVPAGTFQMGSNDGEAGAERNEAPTHEVFIGAPFAIGKFEVTLAEWDACVAAGACKATADDNGWGRGRRPVINVTWAEIQEYLAWLSGITKKTYRLPSEAEWEYAARAGTATRFSWGNAIGRNRANCEACGSAYDNKNTAPVGTFPANPFGLHDMHGNVWEFVQDCWNDDYGPAPSDGTPALSGDCGRRVMRGGSWNNNPLNLRAAKREPMDATSRSYDIGFRVVRVLD